MRDNDLFQLALGITSPWFVASSEFDAAKRRLDIALDFKSGARFDCPACNASGCPVHDTVEKTWRHLDFFQHQAFLTARTPRISCTKCGVRLVAVPWARPGSGFTLLFEGFAMALAMHMPIRTAAGFLKITDKRMWRVVFHYVGAAVARMDLSRVRRVAIDETAAKTTSRSSPTSTTVASCSSPTAATPTRSVSWLTISTATAAMPAASSRHPST
jgi:transposase